MLWKLRVIGKCKTKVNIQGKKEGREERENKNIVIRWCIKDFRVEIKGKFLLNEIYFIDTQYCIKINDLK